jgi:hypothetical protein
MNLDYLTSTADFRRVNKQLRRRVLKRKFETHHVQITFVGGLFKARYNGQSDVAFSDNEHQAVQRLHKLPNMVRFCVVKECDKEADRRERAVERALERAIAKADRRSGR